MPTHITQKTVFEASGEQPKLMEEFVGRLNSESTDISISRVKNPPGWVDPGHSQGFDQYIVVLTGRLCVKTMAGEFAVQAGEALSIPKENWVQVSTPPEDGAEYMSVCLPAFDPTLVKRDPKA